MDNIEVASESTELATELATETTELTALEPAEAAPPVNEPMVALSHEEVPENHPVRRLATSVA